MDEGHRPLRRRALFAPERAACRDVEAIVKGPGFGPDPLPRSGGNPPVPLRALLTVALSTPAAGPSSMVGRGMTLYVETAAADELLMMELFGMFSDRSTGTKLSMESSRLASPYTESPPERCGALARRRGATPPVRRGATCCTWCPPSSGRGKRTAGHPG